MLRCVSDNGDVIGDVNTHVIHQSDEQCEDMYESRQCQIWATVGECELNPVSMEHYCKRSCGLCDPSKCFSSAYVHLQISPDRLAHIPGLRSFLSVPTHSTLPHLSVGRLKVTYAPVYRGCIKLYQRQRILVNGASFTTSFRLFLQVK